MIPDRAVLLLNIRAYDEGVRNRLKEAIERIVTAECQASGSPKKPEFEGVEEGNLAKVIPGNHANNFVPDYEPTLRQAPRR